MKLSRLVVLLLLIAVLGVGVAVLAAPWLLSTDAGRSFILNMVNARIPGRLEVSSLSLSWNSGQRLEGLRLSGRDNEPVLSIDQFVTGATLPALAAGKFQLGRTEISGLKADIFFEKDGASNISKALGAGPSPASRPADRAGAIVLPAPLTAEIVLAGAAVSLRAADIETVELQDLQGRLLAGAASGPLSFEFSTRAVQGVNSGNFVIKGSVSGISSQGVLNLEQADAELMIRAAGLPVDGIDRLLKKNGLLRELLGSNLNIIADVKLQHGNGSAVIEAEAPRLKAGLSLAMQDRVITLQQPALINATLASGLVEKLTGRGKSPLRLTAPVPVRVEIAELRLPINGFRPAAVGLKGRVVVNDGVIRADGPLNGLGWKRLIMAVETPELAGGVKIKLDGAVAQAGREGSLHVDAALSGLFDGQGRLQPEKIGADALIDLKSLPTAMLDGLLGGSNLLAVALGPEIDLRAECRSSGIDTLELNVTASTNNLQASLPLKISDSISLRQPARISYKVSPTLAGRYVAAETMELGSSLPVTMNISRLTAPRPRAGQPLFQPQKTALELELAFGEFTVKAAGFRTTVKKGAFKISGESLTGLTLDGSLVAGLENGLLRDLAGSPVLNVDLRAVLSSLAPLRTTLALDVRSEDMKLNADLALADDLSLRKPALLTLNLSPQAVAGFLAAGREVKGGSDKKKASFVLVKNVPVEIRVPLARLPLKAAGESASAGLGGLAMEAEIKASDLQLSDAGRKQTAALPELQASLTSTGLARGLKFTVRGQGNGSLSVDGSLGRLLAADNRFKPGGATVEFKAEMKDLPTALLDILLGTQQTFAAALGDKITATAGANVDLGSKTGPFACRLQTTHSRAELTAVLGSGLLQLEQPLAAELEVTPSLAKVVLAKVNPLLARAVSADRPITFRVQKEKFQVPIDPFKVEKVQVGEARVEFGLVTLENGGLLQALLGLLNVRAGSRLTAQITPVNARMQNGVARYERTDFILENRIRVASWGEIDLVNDRVRMVLGLPAETMQNSFGVSGLGADYVLQIPVEGTVAEPRVNWEKAGKEIAIMAAGQQLNDKLPGAGMLLQGILGGGKVPAAPKTETPPAPEQPAQQKQSEPQAQQPQKQQPQADPLQQLLNEAIPRIFR